MRKTTTLATALFLLCVSAAAGARQTADETLRMSVPGEKWRMEFSLPGFVVVQNELRGDGRGRKLMAGIEEKGYVVSVFLEPIPDGKTAAELRDWDASGYKKSPLGSSDFKSAEYKQVPTLEYMIRAYRGQRVDQKHFNAYIVHRDFWAHIHLSKMFFRPGDEKLFYAIVDSVKFTDGGGEPPPVKAEARP
jgi:hypothetical protein